MKQGYPVWAGVTCKWNLSRHYIYVMKDLNICMVVEVWHPALTYLTAAYRLSCVGTGPDRTRAIPCTVQQSFSRGAMSCPLRTRSDGDPGYLTDTEGQAAV